MPLPSRHPGPSHIATILVQDHCNDLFIRVAFEFELRIDNLVKEVVLGTGEDWEGRLCPMLRLDMITVQRDVAGTLVMQHSATGHTAMWRFRNTSTVLAR
jgi:hypothetical protein